MLASHHFKKVKGSISGNRPVKWAFGGNAKGKVLVVRRTVSVLALLVVLFGTVPHAAFAGGGDPGIQMPGLVISIETRADGRIVIHHQIFNRVGTPIAFNGWATYETSGLREEGTMSDAGTRAVQQANCDEGRLNCQVNWTGVVNAYSMVDWQDVFAPPSGTWSAAGRMIFNFASAN